MRNQEKELSARDEHAEEFEDWYLQKGYYYDWVEKNTVMSNLKLQKEDIVLDVGCGTGRFTMNIARRCKKVYGIDFSSKSIEVLNRKASKMGTENIETYVCNITESLPIKEKVDKIISVQVIQHIPTEAGRRSVLSKLYDQLKPKGVCVISVYNWNPRLNPGILKEGEFSNGIYYIRSTPMEIEELYKKCGFKNISIRGCINFKWYNYKILNNPNLYKLFYPIAIFDTKMSRFKFSSSLGSFLVCKGTK
jgi:SAM-dependent methyltransferase